MPSRSSDAPGAAGDDPFGAALDAALESVLAAVARLSAPLPRVLIDGRSGSGKTTLAARLLARWPLRAVPRVIALDEFYPGWDGLAEASRMAVTGILEPHAAGRPGMYRRWDWARDAPGAPVAVQPTWPLLLEGCGLLTPASHPYADLAVWVNAPEPSRKARALERDGEGYAPHWERWAAQERAHIARHRPAQLADLVFELP